MLLCGSWLFHFCGSRLLIGGWFFLHVYGHCLFIGLLIGGRCFLHVCGHRLFIDGQFFLHVCGHCPLIDCLRFLHVGGLRLLILSFFCFVLFLVRLLLLRSYLLPLSGCKLCDPCNG